MVTHANLAALATWISSEWFEYTGANGVGERLDWHGFQVDSADLLSANRSELDRIPLPADAATLFELVCLVRIARELAPAPRELRWLNHEMINNMLRLGVWMVCELFTSSLSLKKPYSRRPSITDPCHGCRYF